MNYPEKAIQIMDEAEVLVRRGGYNNLSFRDIAAAVGIKSASVHYHFPTKADLAKAVAERYTEQFMEVLGAPSSFKTSQSALRIYVDAYRAALRDDHLMCLCGMMGAEADILPDEVRAEAKHFFEANIDWLSKTLVNDHRLKSSKARSERATQIIATLEGALIMSRVMKRDDVFEAAVKGL